MRIDQKSVHAALFGLVLGVALFAERIPHRPTYGEFVQQIWSRYQSGDTARFTDLPNEEEQPLELKSTCSDRYYQLIGWECTGHAR